MATTNEFMVREQGVTLLDLVDRVLEKGVVLQGDIMLSVANINLVYLGLRVLLCTVDKVEELRAEALKRHNGWQVLPKDTVVQSE